MEFLIAQLVYVGVKVHNSIDRFALRPIKNFNRSLDPVRGVSRCLHLYDKLFRGLPSKFPVNIVSLTEGGHRSQSLLDTTQFFELCSYHVRVHKVTTIRLFRNEPVNALGKLSKFINFVTHHFSSSPETLKPSLITRSLILRQ